jgi:hypothetical protein
MYGKMNITVLILRFIFGAILGGLLTGLAVMTVIWLGDPKLIKMVLMIGGVITLFVAICSTILGDRFLLEVMKIFKIFKYFP